MIGGMATARPPAVHPDARPHEPHLWVFIGTRLYPGFPSAVFTTEARARRWIRRTRASGTLSYYPIDVSAYEWAIATGRYTPRGGTDETPEFIASFSSVHQERYDYDRGALSAG